MAARPGVGTPSCLEKRLKRPLSGSPEKAHRDLDGDSRRSTRRSGAPGLASKAGRGGALSGHVRASEGVGVVLCPPGAQTGSDCSTALNSSASVGCSWGPSLIGSGGSIGGAGASYYSLLRRSASRDSAASSFVDPNPHSGSMNEVSLGGGSGGAPASHWKPGSGDRTNPSARPASRKIASISAIRSWSDFSSSTVSPTVGAH